MFSMSEIPQKSKSWFILFWRENLIKGGCYQIFASVEKMNGEQPNLIDLPVFMDNVQQQQQHQLPIQPAQYIDYPAGQDFLEMQLASKNKVKSTRKQKFSPEEDEKLRSLVAHYGLDWKMISAVMKNRTPRQCRDRWKNYVSPNVNSAPWTAEEDALLLDKFKEFGRQWAIIAKFFNQRTDIHIKNRWVTISHKLGLDPNMDPVQPQTTQQETIPELHNAQATNETPQVINDPQSQQIQLPSFT